MLLLLQEMLAPVGLGSLRHLPSVVASHSSHHLRNDALIPMITGPWALQGFPQEKNATAALLGALGSESKPLVHCGLWWLVSLNVHLNLRKPLVGSAEQCLVEVEALKH